MVYLRKPWTEVPIHRGKDANIDLYFGSWIDSEPYTTHGTLVERDILTQGDPLNPPAKGAVLLYVNRFTHATLDAGVRTETGHSRRRTGNTVYPCRVMAE